MTSLWLFATLLTVSPGLADPGADAVALRGARPYIPGSGSDPTLLARRARELGLSGASILEFVRRLDEPDSEGGGAARGSARGRATDPLRGRGGGQRRACPGRRCGRQS